MKSVFLGWSALLWLSHFVHQWEQRAEIVFDEVLLFPRQIQFGGVLNVVAVGIAVHLFCHWISYVGSFGLVAMMLQKVFEPFTS